MSIDNERRADNAYAALLDYAEDDDLMAAAIDLVTDLYHLAKREGWDMDGIVRVAQIHFNSES
jgi:hypothetical protein